MKKYEFRLEKLLKIKEHQEKEAKIAYAAVLQEKVKMEKQNTELEEDMIKTSGEEFAALNKGDILDFNTINAHMHFQRAARTRISKNIVKTGEMAEELEDLRLKLTDAMKEKKKLEKLEEKDHEKYKKEKKKEEIKLLDDTHQSSNG